MTAADQNKIVSAFTIGYFTSFLKDHLYEERDEGDDFMDSFLIEHRDEIKNTISKLYADVFEIEYSNIFMENCINEMRDSIDDVINSASEEIKKREDSFLEVAFLSGSFLSVADAILPEECDRQKFELIYSELINSLNLNIAWPDFEKLVVDLTSGAPNKKCNSRDELFLMISNNNADARKIYDLRYLLDKLAVHRFFARLSDAGIYFSSFLLFLSLN